MPNQQLYPQSSYPLTGDIQSEPGSPIVTTTGIQNTPFSPTKPTEGQVPVFDIDTNQWVPADPIVSGPDEVGTEPTVNPVQVSGIDEGNLVRELRTDTYGGLRSIRMEELLLGILLELRAVKAAILNLDSTAKDMDYMADQFMDQELQGE